MNLPSSPPDPRVYGPQKIAAVVAILAEGGVAPEQILAGSDLTEAILQDPMARISFPQIATVFRNAARLATDPAAAIHAGDRMHLTAYGMYGYGLLSSPSHAELMAFMLKYYPLQGPVAGAMACDRQPDKTVFSYEVMVSADPEEPAYRFALEFAAAAHRRMARDLYGPSFGFTKLRFVCPPPADTSHYRELFGCPVEFSQPCNEVWTEPKWVNLRSGLPDLVTHVMVGETCQRMLAALPQTQGLSATIRRALIDQMPWRFRTLEAMARHLAMSPRALRRRLEGEGTSYKEILAGVRKRLAIDYLQGTRMTTEEIAVRLGYSDASNFRQAFIGWTGKNPRDYRLP